MTKREKYKLMRKTYREPDPPEHNCGNCHWSGTSATRDDGSGWCCLADGRSYSCVDLSFGTCDAWEARHD